MGQKCCGLPIYDSLITLIELTNIIYYGIAQNDGNSYELAPTLEGPLMTGELERVRQRARNYN